MKNNYFGALHARLSGLYHTNCEDCGHEGETLNLAADRKFKKLLKSVSKAFKKLYKNGKYNADDLKDNKAFKEVIKDTNSFLSRGLKDNDLSESMQKSLREDIFFFSGLKTHAQLYEASRNLRTQDGQLKSFSEFSEDTKSIKENYNQNYLEAEYDFAKGSVLMAERWERFKDSDRYALQYRTAGDDKVRDSHRELNRITRPKDDPFWDQFFPPNGWRCRCTTLEVLKRNNELTDQTKAAKEGKKATSQINKKGQNKLEIFRFNAGKEKVAFPPNHPYRKVRDADRAKAVVDGVYDKENDKLK